MQFCTADTRMFWKSNVAQLLASNCASSTAICSIPKNESGVLDKSLRYVTCSLSCHQRRVAAIVPRFAERCRLQPRCGITCCWIETKELTSWGSHTPRKLTREDENDMNLWWVETYHSWWPTLFWHWCTAEESRLCWKSCPCNAVSGGQYTNIFTRFATYHSEWWLILWPWLSICQHSFGFGVCRQSTSLNLNWFWHTPNNSWQNLKLSIFPHEFIMRIRNKTSKTNRLPSIRWTRIKQSNIF